MADTATCGVAVEANFVDFTVIKNRQRKVIEDTCFTIPVFELVWLALKYLGQGDTSTFSVNVGMA